MSLKDDPAVSQREERMIASQANAVAGAKSRATLMENDAARPDHLTTERFDAQSLRVGVAPVA
jgi:hypothetical protein